MRIAASATSATDAGVRGRRESHESVGSASCLAILAMVARLQPVAPWIEFKHAGDTGIALCFSSFSDSLRRFLMENGRDFDVCTITVNRRGVPTPISTLSH